MSDGAVTPEELDWLADGFVGNLWQVHSEFCTSFGENHCCDVDQRTAEDILRRLGWQG